MFLEKIEIGQILPVDLKKGNKIINVGIVESIETYLNVVVVVVVVVVVKIKDGRINNALNQIELPNRLVKIECIDGRACIFN